MQIEITIKATNDHGDTIVRKIERPFTEYDDGPARVEEAKKFGEMASEMIDEIATIID